jgi:virulence factor Mce-like protein
MSWKSAHRLIAIGTCTLLTSTGCAFQGINSLPLPGVVGRGSGSATFHIEIANVGTLEANSPVMISDVVVGSIANMTLNGWHADVEVSVLPSVVVPANAMATIGQTSLLGSQHLSLNPPLGQLPVGRLQAGATIPLDRSSTYPSTEQTLSALSAVVNSGGLGQIGDIVHSFNAALSGRQDTVRDLLTRLDTFVGMLNDQRDNIVATIHELNNVAGIFAGQRDALSRALHKIPPALDVLLQQEPRFVTALDKLRVFSTSATGLINDTQTDLVKNLKNLEPAVRALADVGPDLPSALAYMPVFPYGQSYLERSVRGDYFNLFSDFDLTVPRLKKGLLLGTRWGQEGMSMVPAPGDAGYDRYYTTHPLAVGVTPPPPQHPLGGCTLTSWTCSIPVTDEPLAPGSRPRPPIAPLPQPDQGGG